MGPRTSNTKNPTSTARLEASQTTCWKRATADRGDKGDKDNVAGHAGPCAAPVLCLLSYAPAPGLREHCDGPRRRDAPGPQAAETRRSSASPQAARPQAGGPADHEGDALGRSDSRPADVTRTRRVEFLGRWLCPVTDLPGLWWPSPHRGAEWHSGQHFPSGALYTGTCQDRASPARHGWQVTGSLGPKQKSAELRLQSSDDSVPQCDTQTTVTPPSKEASSVLRPHPFPCPGETGDGCLSRRLGTQFHLQRMSRESGCRAKLSGLG